MSEKNQKNLVFQSLFQASAVKNILTGLVGRIGDQVIIDHRLDAAISTAGGGHWNKVMTKTVESARAAIEYLRKEKVGVCSFLAMNQ